MSAICTFGPARPSAHPIRPATALSRAVSRAVSAAALALLATAGSLAAQNCPTRFLKNDTLPDVPPATPTGVAVIRGLCEGEAAFSVFPNVQGNVTVEQVSVMFAAQGGVNGNVAAADIEFYDGATANAGGTGVYQLGPLLWSLSGSGNANAQLQSHGLNVVDLTPFGASAGQGPQVTVTSGQLVVAVRCVLNQNGSCAGGYFANLATDYAGFGAGCPAPGVNGIIDLQATAFDPATYPFPGALGLTLCHPLINAYGGNWIIRACITEAAPAALTTWQGFPQPGGAVLIQLDSAGTPGDGFVTLLGGGITTGTVLPWGTWPIDLDGWTMCFLGACRSLLTNGMGSLDASGRAITTLLIPADPSLVGSGLTWYATFFAYDPTDFFQWTAIGAPSAPIIIN